MPSRKTHSTGTGNWRGKFFSVHVNVFVCQNSEPVTSNRWLHILHKPRRASGDAGTNTTLRPPNTALDSQRTLGSSSRTVSVEEPSDDPHSTWVGTLICRRIHNGHVKLPRGIRWAWLRTPRPPARLATRTLNQQI